MTKATTVLRGLCLFAAMASIALAAVDFTGAWVLDTAKSDTMRMGGGFGGGNRPGGRPPEGGRMGSRAGRPGAADFKVTLNIKQAGNTLSVKRVFGEGRSTEMNYTLDGKENKHAVQGAMGRGGESITRSKWKGDVLIIEGTQKLSTPRGDFDIEIKEEYALSAGGKVLTVTTTRTTPDREQIFKQVYNRKQ
jgi:hypothetical protein